MDIVYGSNALFTLWCEMHFHTVGVPVHGVSVYRPADLAWGQCVQATRSCKNGVGAHTATMSTRPCVVKTQKRGSRAHTRPRTRVDVKLSHKRYELQLVSKRVSAFPNKVVARFGCNFRMLHVGGSAS